MSSREILAERIERAHRLGDDVTQIHVALVIADAIDGLAAAIREGHERAEVYATADDAEAATTRRKRRNS